MGFFKPNVENSTSYDDMLDIKSVALAHQRVVIREDLNVPLAQGKITSDARIKAALPTIQHALSQQAIVTVISHLGRPVVGEDNIGLSLQPVATALSDQLNVPVTLVKTIEEAQSKANDIHHAGQYQQLILLENIRFFAGETSNDDAFAKQLAALADVFVMDAFANSHRAHASVVGLAQFAPIACAGLLLMQELQALNKILQAPCKPTVAIVGGSKVSSKLSVLTHLLDKVDVLIVGGGIANTFLAATGVDVGASLYEPDLIEMAKDILGQAQAKKVKMPLPKDVVVAQSLDDEATVRMINLKNTTVQANEMILDIGMQSVAQLKPYLQQASTILWNGPVGVFEKPVFSQGTQQLAQLIADNEGFSVAGGGDTIAAIDQFQIAQQIDYISTAGGAFLEMIEGKTLPGIAILNERV